MMDQVMQPSDAERKSRWPKDGMPKGAVILFCQGSQIRTQKDAGLRLVMMMVQGLGAGFSIFGEGWLRVAECSCYAASAIGSLLMLCTYSIDFSVMEKVVNSALRGNSESVIKQTFQQSEQMYWTTAIYQGPLRMFANSLHLVALVMTLVKCFIKA